MIDVEDPAEELVLQKDETEPQRLRFSYFQAAFPFVALIPIIGLCFGDLPPIAGLTSTKFYLGLTIASALSLIVAETVLSGCIPHAAFERLRDVGPILVASGLSFAAARLTRFELPMEQVSWTFTCQVALLLWLVYLSYLPRMTELLGWVILIATVLVSLIFFRMWYAEGRPFPYAGLSVHKNAMGVAMMCLGALCFSVRDTKGFLSPKNVTSSLSILLLVCVLLICGARSALLVLMATIGFALLFQSLNSKLLSRVVGTSILTISILFPVTYVSLEGSRLGEQISSMSLDVTGQDVYNGRQKLWSVLLEEFWQRPIFGYGRQVAFERDEEIPMNAHNLMLATLYQAGLLGGVAFVFLLRKLWFEFEGDGLEVQHWVPLAFLAAVLIRQMLESELSGENYTSMFAIWSTLLLTHAGRQAGDEYEEY